MPEFTVEIVEDVLSSFFRRCELIKLAGGISKLEVMEGRKLPPGYWADLETDYFLPPHVTLESLNAKPS